MAPHRAESLPTGSFLIRLAIVVAGVASIVASSGGMIGVAGCGDYCKPLEPPGPAPWALVTPAGQTVQVGTPAVIRVQVSNLTNPVYRWCRSAGAGQPCQSLVGSNSNTYTLASARLEDDGSRFQVTVTGYEGMAISGFSELAVSSMPGVVFQDGEFDATAWSVTTRAVTGPGGPPYRLSRNPAGGNPGAWLGIEYTLDSLNPTVSLDHANLAATYDPGSQGAIHRVDFAEDCRRTASPYLPGVAPLIEQGGRRFGPTPGTQSAYAICAVDTWQPSNRPSLQRTDFALIEGPPCGAGESCPDFSATAPPLRFGLTTYTALPTLPAEGSVTTVGHGVDNWKVTVWRK